MEKLNPATVTLLTFYHFPGFWRAYFAFSVMGIMKFGKMKAPGMMLGKMLGTGSGIGFGLKPNLNKYATISIFENEAQAQSYLRNSKLLKSLRKYALKETVILLETTQSRGEWDGKIPYTDLSEFKNGKIAVLTRAKLRFTKIPSFWKTVSPVNESLSKSSGLLFSAGMGEWPFSHPITFSIWDKCESMENFAIHKTEHSTAVKLAIEGKWFRESLFVRYNVIEMIQTP